MTYDRICEVETAQAKLVQHLKSLSLPLPICPIDEESKVLTTFWWNNLYQKIETASWGRVYPQHTWNYVSRRISIYSQLQ